MINGHGDIIEAGGGGGAGRSGSAQEDVVRLLLEHGANPNVALEDDGSTPLHIACERASPKCVKMLLGAGGGVDAAATGGFTPLMTACDAGQPECVRLLCSAGASVSTTNSNGLPPLAVATGARQVTHPQPRLPSFGPAPREIPLSHEYLSFSSNASLTQ